MTYEHLDAQTGRTVIIRFDVLPAEASNLHHPPTEEEPLIEQVRWLHSDQPLSNPETERILQAVWPRLIKKANEEELLSPTPTPNLRP